MATLTMNGLAQKSANECISMAITRGKALRTNAFEVALLCATATSATTKGSVSQNEFARRSEISKGTLSEIMKAFKAINDAEELAYFEENPSMFKYCNICRVLLGKNKDLFTETPKAFVEMSAEDIEKRLAPTSSESERKESKGTVTEGTVEVKSEESNVAAEGVIVTDELGNKYMIPSEILAQYAI